jgi:hypothetical protein
LDARQKLERDAACRGGPVSDLSTDEGIPVDPVGHIAWPPGEKC